MCGRIGYGILLALLACALGFVAGCSRSEVTTEKIPHTTTMHSDSTLWDGEKRYYSQGKDGIKQITWRVSGSGANVKREKASEKIISEPVEEVVTVGTKLMATGRTIEVNDRNRNFTFEVLDVERNSAGGNDTLQITARVTNNDSDGVLDPDHIAALIVNRSGRECGGTAHFASETGFMKGHDIRGAESVELVYDFHLRLGSTLRADAESVDDFTLLIRPRPYSREAPLREALNRFWIGPIEHGGQASSQTEASPKEGALPDIKSSNPSAKNDPSVTGAP